jgi:hypothetical protein
MTVRHIFEISEDDHPRLVTHARDIWWTLDSANAFVSPGVNSRGELVPSHGGSGITFLLRMTQIYYTYKKIIFGVNRTLFFFLSILRRVLGRNLKCTGVV